MLILSKYPLYVFLLVIFFCLHGVNENFGAITFAEAFETGLWVSLFLVILFLIGLWISKSKLFSGFFAFLLGLNYLFFGAIKESLKYFTIISSYKILLPFIAILLIITLVLVNRNKKSYTRITVFLNLLFLIYCSYDIIVLCRNFIVEKKTFKNDTFNFNYKTVVKKPNIYYLLFDEYAGYESLKDSMNFKNDVLFNNLISNGFDSVPIFSNYFFTPFSMSSIFNMKYVNRFNNNSIVTAKEIQNRTAEIKNATLFRILDTLGYEIKNYSFFDILSHKNIGGSGFLVGHSRVLTNKTLHSQIFKDIGWNFMVSKNQVPFVQKLFLGDLPEYNFKVEKGLIEALKNKSVSPQFVYAHFLMPHKPYFFDSLGTATTLSSHFNLDTAHESIAYLSYLKYCNKKIMYYVSEINKNDSTSLIVIMSDHGRKEFSDKNVNSQLPFNNICFVRGSDAEKKDHNAIGSNVNFFRNFFNKNFKQHIPYILDSTFYLEDVVK
jgi:hypothetical protein